MPSECIVVQRYKILYILRGIPARSHFGHTRCFTAFFRSCMKIVRTGKFHARKILDMYWPNGQKFLGFFLIRVVLFDNFQEKANYQCSLQYSEGEFLVAKYQNALSLTVSHFLHSRCNVLNEKQIVLIQIFYFLS